MANSLPETKLENESLDRHFDTTHLKQDLGRRAVRGGAVLMGSQAVRFLLRTARIIVLARLLQPADFGLVAMVTVITGFIGMFQDLGLNMATLTREKITHAQVSTLLWINLAVGVALASTTAAIAPLLSWFYGEARLIPITLVLAPTFLLVGLTVQHQALLRRQMRFAALGVIRILAVSVGLTTGIFMAWSGAGYWALVGITIASSATNAIAVWIACSWRPGLPARGVGVGSMIRFGGNITGANLVNYFSRRLDYILLGWWWGAAPLGLYTKAVTLMQAPMNRVLNPIGAVVVTSLSRVAGEPERYRNAYLRTLEKVALISMPMAVFMVASADWLIPLLLGPRWVETAPIFGTLAILAGLRPIERSHSWLLITQNRAHQALRWSLIGGLITSLAIVIGLPRGGLGVANALVIAAFLRLPLVIWYVARQGPIRAFDIYRTLATPAVASACALFVLIGLAPRADGLAPAVVLASVLAITGVVFLAILCVLPAGRRALLDVWSSFQELRG